MITITAKENVPTNQKLDTCKNQLTVHQKVNKSLGNSNKVLRSNAVQSDKANREPRRITKLVKKKENNTISAVKKVITTESRIEGESKNGNSRKNTRKIENIKKTP